MEVSSPRPHRVSCPHGGTRVSQGHSQGRGTSLPSGQLPECFLAQQQDGLSDLNLPPLLPRAQERFHLPVSAGLGFGPFLSTKVQVPLPEGPAKEKTLSHACHFPSLH